MKASITFYGAAATPRVKLFKFKLVFQTVSYVMCFLSGKPF
jgi:hypothetical protein